MYLFFDTETNGRPLSNKAPITQLDNWPRIIQLAWALYDKDGVLLQSFESLIKPNEWVVPNEKFWIDNGFSTALCELEGRPIYSVLDEFCTAIQSCEVLIAHNIDFDYPITAAEMIRANLRANKIPSKFCTMKASENICKIPGLYGKFKWPKLQELHVHLFGTEFIGAHDALDDVMATAKCFFEMQKQNLIELPKNYASLL